MAQIDHVLGGEGASAPSLAPINFRQEFEPSQIGEALENLRINLSTPYPQWEPSTERPGRFCVVGGGPSLAGSLETLRSYADEPDVRIVALNECADFLVENGIEPWGQCFMEIEYWEPDFLAAPQGGLVYLVSSAANPVAYERLKEQTILQWHACEDIGEADLIHAVYPDAPLVNGGVTAASRSLFIGYASGYRKFDLFGMDSSIAEHSHAYKDQRDQSVLDVHCAGRDFRTPPYLARQADDFRQIFQNLKTEFADLRVHGDGLLPHISKFFLKHATQE